MKISLDWLADYVDLDDVEPADLADRLTLATAEVETLVEIRTDVEGVASARVIAVAPSVDDPRQQVVTLDLGDGRTVTTASNATNLGTGMCTAYAERGAPVALRTVDTGRPSQIQSAGGAVCSVAELGWSALPDQAVDLPRSVAPGTPLRSLLRVVDHIIEIDNKSLTHRPDLWGHYGFAREVAAVLRRPLRPLLTADFAAWDHLAAHPLTVDARDGCPVYCCIAVDIACKTASSLLVQQRLHAIGLHTIGAVPDACNYVMLDLGQPTQAYDRDAVGGLRVARAGHGRNIITADGEGHALSARDLLIFGDRGPVAIAGVMGGVDTAGSGSTRLLLESATFDPVDVRRTTVRLGLRTESSQRYEKGQPPFNARVGLGRLLHLLDAAGLGATPVSAFTMAGDEGGTGWYIRMAASAISDVAGVPIARDITDPILASLGFGSTYEGDELVVAVPPFRSRADIGLSVDVVGEVLRIHGFGQIQARMPRFAMQPTPTSPGANRAKAVRRVLAATHRMHEIETPAWFDDAWLAALGYDPGPTLRLRNPVAPGKARLRTTLMPHLLRVVQQNLDHADDFAVFEIGHVFVPGAALSRRSSDPQHSEQQHLAVATVAHPRSQIAEAEQVRRIVSALEDLGRAVGDRELRVSPAATSAAAPWQRPGSWAEIVDQGAPVGTAGLLPAGLRSTVAGGRQVVWLELDLDLVKTSPTAVPRYRAIPEVPGSRQDIAVLWPVDRPYSELEAIMGQFRHPLCSQWRLVSAFSGEPLPPDRRSFTFRFWLQDPARTLLEADISSFRSQLVSYLKRHDLSLR